MRYFTSSLGSDFPKVFNGYCLLVPVDLSPGARLKDSYPVSMIIAHQYPLYKINKGKNTPRVITKLW